jgi:hypothetical protein
MTIVLPIRLEPVMQVIHLAAATAAACRYCGPSERKHK